MSATPNVFIYAHIVIVPANQMKPYSAIFPLFLLLLLGPAIFAQAPPVSDDQKSSAESRELKPGTFVNPISEGADPWVIRDPNQPRYLWCQSERNRGIAICASKYLTSLGSKHVVWRAPDSGPISREIWAPELHLLDGKWVIYFAASDGENANHLAYALRSKTDDPLGEYALHGPFATGDGADGKSPNIWAIDMTPLEYDGKRYALWSGWDAPGTDQQFLYIARMISATELAGPRVRICSNDDYPWEFTMDGDKGRGLNEGPQVIKNAGKTFVTYSCGGSWLPTYKLGLLELTGSDPLDSESWKKLEKPVFTSTKETYGVGHSCFAKSQDGKEWWHIFHAKRDRKPGWRRAIYVQPMGFSDDGSPSFGEPTPAGKVLPRPSGESDGAASTTAFP
ncbi:MAG: GH43 family beta-xylosidase [Verrucomicrobiales bacterium]|jgi:GH43 family beta-xylosidase